jgi:hypothetical protein
MYVLVVTNMYAYRLALKCPYCGSYFDAGPPDSWHNECSLDKPPIDIQRATIIQEKHTCKNPKCNKPIDVYWFNPMEYYNTM